MFITVWREWTINRIGPRNFTNEAKMFQNIVVQKIIFHPIGSNVTGNTILLSNNGQPLLLQVCFPSDFFPPVASFYLNQGARYLPGENLEVVWADEESMMDFSTSRQRPRPRSRFKQPRPFRPLQT